MTAKGEKEKRGSNSNGEWREGESAKRSNEEAIDLSLDLRIRQRCAQSIVGSFLTTRLMNQVRTPVSPCTFFNLIID